jgi:hypothetical protein
MGQWARLGAAVQGRGGWPLDSKHCTGEALWQEDDTQRPSLTYPTVERVEAATWAGRSPSASVGVNVSQWSAAVGGGHGHGASLLTRGTGASFWKAKGSSLAEKQ